ncbi:hypothetical protein [Pandoraea captiosa]|uniref:hypothetical protein n=1 Tax=Pandoraea captiosa TaxID=2508302 RepID=UPI0015817B15|nr:hypothetical protein [Pandoraea captiosa]
MLVSEMEKNPEQTIRKATAQICAHKGKASKLLDARQALGVAMSCHYIRGDNGARDAAFSNRRGIARWRPDSDGLQSVHPGRSDRLLLSTQRRRRNKKTDGQCRRFFCFA